jgi:hypothetical protein
MTPDCTKLERLDRTKFKLTFNNILKAKKDLFIFRCHDTKECDLWVVKIQTELDKLKVGSPFK